VPIANSLWRLEDCGCAVLAVPRAEAIAGLMIRPSMSIPIANPDCFVVHSFEQMHTS
jgi:hypothetical protein